MSMLRRSFAPLTETQWEEIDDEARTVLERTLVARRFVDVDGPHGWTHSAYNLGRLGEPVTDGDVTWRPRKVRPVVEVRVPFSLAKAELDDLDRGAPEVDLDPVTKAAQAVARFEETVIYHGLAAAGIEGLYDAADAESLKLPTKPSEMLAAVTEGMIELSNVGVVGPYLLVLGEAPFGRLASTSEGYPALRQLEELLGIRPAFSHGLEGAVLASTRGGDFVLSLGVDASIGFDRADATHVHLYLTESFTFDVPGPEAVVTFST